MTLSTSSDWILVAKGELGDSIDWEPEYDVFEDAKRLLCETENFDKTDFDFCKLTEGLPRLWPIVDMDFPPLYNEASFEELDGFLAITEEPEEEGPSGSFAQLELYLDANLKSELLDQFEKFVSRLEVHPKLKDLEQ